MLREPSGWRNPAETRARTWIVRPSLCALELNSSQESSVNGKWQVFFPRILLLKQQPQVWIKVCVKHWSICSKNHASVEHQFLQGLSFPLQVFCLFSSFNWSDCGVCNRSPTSKWLNDLITRKWQVGQNAAKYGKGFTWNPWRLKGDFLSPY